MRTKTFLFIFAAVAISSCSADHSANDEQTQDTTLSQGTTVPEDIVPETDTPVHPDKDSLIKQNNF